MSGHLKKNAAGHLTKNAAGHLAKCVSAPPCCVQSGKPYAVSIVMPSGGCDRADGTYILDPGSSCQKSTFVSIVGSTDCASFDYYGADYTPGDNVYWAYRLESITLHLVFSESTPEIDLTVTLTFRRMIRREDTNICTTFDFKNVTHTFRRSSCDAGVFALLSSTTDWPNLGVKCVPTSVTIA